MSFMKIPPSFSIFPVQDKKPLVPWGEYSKRPPTAQERVLWNVKYPTCQFGIATGKVSGIIVLDDDGGLDVNRYRVPKTWTVSTPRGGKHYYFRWCSALDWKVTTKTEICPKVDIRGEGGFVVFYGWERPYFMQPLALPPQWLIDLLPNKNNTVLDVTHGDKSQFQEVLNNVHNGNRNDSFTRLAGSLRARGYGSDDIFGILSSKARETGFHLAELKTICDSVSRYEPNIKVDDSQAESIESFLNKQERVEWLCDGVIAKEALHFVAGLNGTMKTWSLIDLAVECAKGGGMWLNKFPVKGAKVLFIDQERFRGETQRRFKAVIGAKSLKLKDLKLFIKTGTTIRLDLQTSFDAFKKVLGELRPDLIIVDSFATFHTKNENLRQEIQMVLERIKELRNEFGCSFIFIHHENGTAYSKENQDSPNTGQMAGSEAIPAAADVVLTVRKQDSESSMVYMTKNNLAPAVAPFLVKVSDVNEDRTKIQVEAY